ncbi:hypothetical protein JXI42_01705 [bacterium]|nr:hypothetical protein [bacterium]
MKYPYRLLIPIIVVLSFTGNATRVSGETAGYPVLSEDFPHFLEKIYTHDTLTPPLKWSVTAQETVTVYKDGEFTEIKGRAIKTKRYVYKGDEVIEEEVLKEKIEGDYPDRKGKRGSFEGNAMPFSRDAQKDYQYLDYGVVDLNDTEARKISFKAVERDDEHFDGIAYFNPKTALLKKMEITYADNPTAIKDWKAVMTFRYIDGYRIMEDFEMDLRGGLLLVIKFNVRVRQHLSDIEVLE